MQYVNTTGSNIGAVATPNTGNVIGAIATPNTGNVIGAIETPNTGNIIGAISTPNTGTTIGAITTPNTGTIVQSGYRYPAIGLNNVTCPIDRLNVVLPAGCEGVQIGVITNTNTSSYGNVNTSGTGT